jgi:hypothetical protein
MFIDSPLKCELLAKLMTCACMSVVGMSVWMDAMDAMEMHACMRAWVDGWMEMHACMRAWVDGWMEMHACMCAWVDGWMEMHACMGENMDGDACMHG